MSYSPSVDLVLPVLDEAEALSWVLGRVPHGVRPIVVDNGSTDGSAAIAIGLGATVIDQPQRGFGAACFAGLSAATADLVAFCDADGSIDPSAVLAMAQLVAADRADLVLGARRPVGRRAWPLHARTANRYLARRVSRATGTQLRDIGPLRIARRADLLALGLHDRRFGWPLEMVLRAGAEGWRITEIPVAYYKRTGRSKVTGTIRGTARAIHDMQSVLNNLRPTTGDLVHGGSRHATQTR